MPNPKGRGRIRNSDREINDSCKIIRGNLHLKADYLSSIQHIETHSSTKHKLDIATA